MVQRNKMFLLPVSVIIKHIQSIPIKKEKRIQ